MTTAPSPPAPQSDADVERIAGELLASTNDARNWADSYTPAEDFRQNGWLLTFAERMERGASAIRTVIAERDAKVERLTKALEATRNRVRQGTMLFDDLDPEDKAVIRLADAALSPTDPETGR